MAKGFKLERRRPGKYLNVRTGQMTRLKSVADQWYDAGDIIGLMYPAGMGYKAVSYVQPGTNRFCAGCDEETGKLYDFIDGAWVPVD